MEKKAKKKWGKWVIVAVVLCVIGAVQDGGVSSAEDGQKVLEKIFPPEEGYHIRFDQKVNGWEGYFDVEVGEACDHAYKGEQIDVYAYYVWLDESRDAFCGVSETGKVLGWGPLVPGSRTLPLVQCRLK